MSSLAIRCGLEWEFGWLGVGGLFMAVELAAADLLLQLSRDYEAAAAASTAKTFPSLRSAAPCCEVLVTEETERIVKETAPLPLGSRARSVEFEYMCYVHIMHLDERRKILNYATIPNKRYFLLLELYSAPRPGKPAAPAAKKKRKRHHDGGESESPSSEATRYGEY
ncbi:hypothetical protein VPH35_099180 [Triticum aestivum]